jgi:hypothetical protein
MPRSSRSNGKELGSLFGLDDCADAMRPKKLPKKTSPTCNAVNLTAPPQPPGTLHLQPVVPAGAPVLAPAPPPLPPQLPPLAPPPSLPPPYAAGGNAPPGRLSKDQWKLVGKIRLVDHYADEPDIQTSYIKKPVPQVDNHYFWLFWDNAYGKVGKDQVGWTVADLNKHLLAGKLTFKLDGSTPFDAQPWISVMPPVQVRHNLSFLSPSTIPAPFTTFTSPAVLSHPLRAFVFSFRCSDFPCAHSLPRLFVLQTCQTFLASWLASSLHPHFTGF